MNLLVVLPLKPGTRDRARALLRCGPPFDPDSVGLERHEVFLTDEEAVFLFEAEAGSEEVAEHLAASGWSELGAGPPRLAEGVYSWVRPYPPDEAFFTPTPGPGDSDGGDLYEP